VGYVKQLVVRAMHGLTYVCFTFCVFQVCGPGVPVSAIGAICADVAQKHKLTVVRDFIGHGVGTVFHAAPQVLHHRNMERDKMQVRQVV
jgi:methionine aminopeptidase